VRGLNAAISSPASNRGDQAAALTNPLVFGARLSYAIGVEEIRLADGREWLSVADICEYIGVSAFVVTKLLRTGELPAVKFGREWRVARVDFEDYINRRRAQVQEKGPILRR